MVVGVFRNLLCILQRSHGEKAYPSARRNYAWALLMMRVFNHPTNCIACRSNVRPSPDHSSVPSALWAGNRLRQIVTSNGVKTGLSIVTPMGTCCGCQLVVVSAGQCHFRAT